MISRKAGRRLAVLAGILVVSMLAAVSPITAQTTTQDGPIPGVTPSEVMVGVDPTTNRLWIKVAVDGPFPTPEDIFSAFVQMAMNLPDQGEDVQVVVQVHAGLRDALGFGTGLAEFIPTVRLAENGDIVFLSDLEYEGGLVQAFAVGGSLAVEGENRLDAEPVFGDFTSETLLFEDPEVLCGPYIRNLVTGEDLTPAVTTTTAEPSTETTEAVSTDTTQASATDTTQPSATDTTQASSTESQGGSVDPLEFETVTRERGGSVETVPRVPWYCWGILLLLLLSMVCVLWWYVRRRHWWTWCFLRSILILIWMPLLLGAVFFYRPSWWRWPLLVFFPLIWGGAWWWARRRKWWRQWMWSVPLAWSGLLVIGLFAWRPTLWILPAFWLPFVAVWSWYWAQRQPWWRPWAWLVLAAFVFYPFAWFWWLTPGRVWIIPACAIPIGLWLWRTGDCDVVTCRSKVCWATPWVMAPLLGFGLLEWFGWWCVVVVVAVTALLLMQIFCWVRHTTWWLCWFWWTIVILLIIPIFIAALIFFIPTWWFWPLWLWIPAIGACGWWWCRHRRWWKPWMWWVLVGWSVVIGGGLLLFDTGIWMLGVFWLPLVPFWAWYWGKRQPWWRPWAPIVLVGYAAWVFVWVLWLTPPWVWIFAPICGLAGFVVWRLGGCSVEICRMKLCWALPWLLIPILAFCAWDEVDRPTTTERTPPAVSQPSDPVPATTTSTAPGDPVPATTTTVLSDPGPPETTSTSTTTPLGTTATLPLPPGIGTIAGKFGLSPDSIAGSVEDVSVEQRSGNAPPLAPEPGLDLTQQGYFRVGALDDPTFGGMADQVIGNPDPAVPYYIFTGRTGLPNDRTLIQLGLWISPSDQLNDAPGAPDPFGLIPAEQVFFADTPSGDPSEPKQVFAYSVPGFNQNTASNMFFMEYPMDGSNYFLFGIPQAELPVDPFFAWLAPFGRNADDFAETAFTIGPPMAAQ